MDFPNTIFPRISHTIRNFFFARMLITPYFDQDFSIKDFSRGASESATMVSRCLSEGDLESLVELLTPEVCPQCGEGRHLLQPHAPDRHPHGGPPHRGEPTDQARRVHLGGTHISKL